MNKVSRFFCGKVFANKTKLHLFQPKYMNLYFKKSVAPRLKMLNLVNVDAIDFYVEERVEGNNSSYLLNAMLNNDYNNVMELAEFSNKADAEDALLEIRVKASSPIKTVGKWLVVFTMLVLFVNSAFSLASIFVPSLKQGQQVKTNINLPSIEQAERELGLPPGTTPRNDQVQVQELIKQLQQMQSGQIQSGQPSAEQPNIQQQIPEEQLSPTDRLLRGIQ